MKCENCPAGWEDRGYEGECYDCGCVIYGDFYDCNLSEKEIRKRLKQWDEYTEGKIERPKWVENKFFRMMDYRIYSCPSFPPKKMRNGCHESIYSSDQLSRDVVMSKEGALMDAIGVVHDAWQKYCQMVVEGKTVTTETFKNTVVNEITTLLENK